MTRRPGAPPDQGDADLETPPDSSWFLLARLAWAPRHLPHAALRCTRLSALVVATLVATLEVMLVMVVAIAGIDEPYPTIRAYLQSTTNMLPAALLAATILIAPAVITMGLVISLGPPRAHAGARILLFAPIALLLPVLLWTPLALAVNLAHPTLGIGAGKPAWAEISSLRFLGAPYGLAALFVADVSLVAFAGRRLRDAEQLRDSGRTCARCGYALIGLARDRCPECGATVGGGEST